METKTEYPRYRKGFAHLYKIPSEESQQVIQIYDGLGCSYGISQVQTDLAFDDTEECTEADFLKAATRIREILLELEM